MGAGGSWNVSYVFVSGEEHYSRVQFTHLHNTQIERLIFGDDSNPSARRGRGRRRLQGVRGCTNDPPSA